MANPKKILTAQKRVLLYLSTIPNKYGDSFDAPFSITQMGIANNVGIARQNVPRAVNALIDKELVESNKAHIFGLKQRRSIYFLTLSGRESAKKIESKLAEAMVEVIMPDGSRDMHCFKDIPALLPSEYTNTQILKVITDRTLDLDELMQKKAEKTKRLLYSSSGLIEPNYFFGRNRDRA